jgi:hypothetical protein
MITSFVTGIFRLILFVLGNPKILLFLVLLSLITLGGLLFPVSIYLYPFWQSKVDYVDFDLFGNEIPELSTTITTPEWVLPDDEMDYNIIMEMTNLTSEELIVNLDVNKDKPYLEFQDVESLPISNKVVIPAGETAIRKYDFKIHNSSKPKEPIIVTFEIESGQSEVIKAIRLPILYYLLPLFLVIGIFFPIAFYLLRILVKVLIGI